MKLIILLIFAFCLQASATGYGQTVTLSAKNMPLEKVFKEVKRQTNFSFVYTRAQILNTQPVTCNIVNTNLKEALTICFRNQPLTFVIEENYVVVQTKKTAPIPVSLSDTLIDVQGHITNENGLALAGATVIAKYSNRGVSSNTKGDFLLQGIREDDVLIVSCVGFYKMELPVNKQRFFEINLKFAVNSLEETVVKGYYSTSRKNNTGNVVKINGSQITCQPVSNPLLALQGLVPGLLITQTNGLPGSRFSAIIRGQNSIQNGNSPLFVIDGVPFLSDNDALTQLNGVLANSPFNSIDPNNIESIEILKDADATAIYGSRGANGVILITTKKVKADKNSLTLNMYRGWGKVTRTATLMNTPEYLEMRKEAFLNDGVTSTNVNAPDLMSWDQNRYTDWKKMFIGGTAQTYNVQLRYAGGNQFTKFSVGSSYYRETTVFPGEFDDKKTTADFSVNHKSKDNKLNLNFITSYCFDKSFLPAQDLTLFVNLPPNSYPLINDAGKYVWREAGYSVGNPLARLLQKNDVATNRLTANSILTYHPVKALELKANFGYNTVSVNEKIVTPIVSQDPAFAPTGSAAYGDNFIRTWIIEPQASYKINVNSKLRIEMLAGATLQKTTSERKLITGYGYTNDELLGAIASAPAITATNAKAQYNYAAFFGRAGFDWNSKYIINITGRRDASSRFGPGNRLANFGAVGAAWIFSKEAFIENTLPFLSFGKIRGSYGITGNDQIGNYQYLDTYRGTVFAYQGQPGLTPTRLFNSNYSWEENKKLELATELGFFEDRLTVNFNYYKNKSDNQIIRYTLPTQTGFTDILMNFPGVVQNSGYEISLSAAVLSNKKFQWNSSFNIACNNNKLISFPGLANSSYASTYVIGKPLNAYRGLRFTGVNAQTGIYQFDDLNKDGFINNGDYDYLGTTNPKYFGGFSNTLTYKGLQLNLLLEFRNQRGKDIVYSYSGLLGGILNQPVYTLNRWRNAGDAAPYQKYSQEYTGPVYAASNNIAQSSATLVNASYIRLRNVGFSYSFPEKWLKKLQMTNGKIYLQMQNLITITGYKGNDPENQSVSSLPPLRMITVGTLVNF